jgi:hypothetical protein
MAALQQNKIAERITVSLLRSMKREAAPLGPIPLARGFELVNRRIADLLDNPDVRSARSKIKRVPTPFYSRILIAELFAIAKIVVLSGMCNPRVGYSGQVNRGNMALTFTQLMGICTGIVMEKEYMTLELLELNRTRYGTTAVRAVTRLIKKWMDLNQVQVPVVSRDDYSATLRTLNPDSPFLKITEQVYKIYTSGLKAELPGIQRHFVPSSHQPVGRFTPASRMAAAAKPSEAASSRAAVTTRKEVRGASHLAFLSKQAGGLFSLTAFRDIQKQTFQATMEAGFAELDKLASVMQRSQSDLLQSLSDHLNFVRTNMQSAYQNVTAV